MVSTRHGRARPFSMIVALTLVVLSMGVGSAAYADPGNGKGAEKSAQVSQSATPPASQGQAADSPGKSAAAPGQKENDSAAGGQAEGHQSSGTAGTSGDVNEPQPISRADDNEGGANGQCPEGPYCSTRDGSPSENGKGDGKAVGKPCAGCVGKADNKNPQGQMPNGGDHNAGYECDRNQGIGKTNPAHTGCQSQPPGEEPPGEEPPGEEPPSEEPPNEEEPPGEEPGEQPGGNQPPQGEQPPANEPPKDQDRPRPPTDIAGVEKERPPADASMPPGVLPETGTPVAMGLIGGSGLLLMIVGAFTLWLQRRMRATG